MYIIIGLGNPGEEYVFTRHNAGFLAVDTLASHLNCSWRLQKKLHAEIAKNQHIILAKPQTFMNNSGIALRAILSNFPATAGPRLGGGQFLPPSTLKNSKVGGTPPLAVAITNMIVVHDEIDLDFGIIRVSHNSASAGHRGVQSIIEHLGTKDFWRVRIGIRPTLNNELGIMNQGKKQIDTPDFVLKSFSKEEQKRLPLVLKKASEIITEMIEHTPTVKTIHVE